VLAGFFDAAFFDAAFFVPLFFAGFADALGIRMPLCFFASQPMLVAQLGRRWL